MDLIHASEDIAPLVLLVNIARCWPQIHPGDLTAPQALSLLGVLLDENTANDAAKGAKCGNEMST